MYSSICYYITNLTVFYSYGIHSIDSLGVPTLYSQETIPYNYYRILFNYFKYKIIIIYANKINFTFIIYQNKSKRQF